MERFHFNIISSSPEETIGAGERIASLLKGGSVVALQGALGVGKTYLTKGIARGLGVTEEVTSPTYTIISEYQGIFPLYHIDAYRLQGDDDFIALGGMELLYSNGVSVIEWSERIPFSIPDNVWTVKIEFVEQTLRKIQVMGPE